MTLSAINHQVSAIRERRLRAQVISDTTETERAQRSHHFCPSGDGDGQKAYSSEKLVA